MENVDLKQLVSMRGVSAGYGGRPVLRGIDADFLPGRVYGLMGENGVGKTTLMKCMAGGITPVGGSVNAFGFVPCNLDGSFLAEMIMMPQLLTLPAVTAERYVDLYSRFWPRFSHDDFKEYASVFGMDRTVLLNRQSVGQQKAFFLSFALATRSRMILLDEPFAGLDPFAMERMQSVLARFDASDSVVVLSTHQVRGMENLFTDITMLYDGTIAVHASIEALTSRFAFYREGRHPNVVFERGLGSICLNTDGVFTDPDLEMLFCAVCSVASFRAIVKPESMEETIC